MKIFQTAYMPSANFITKMLLPIEPDILADARNAIWVNNNNKSIWGLTGVAVAYDEKIAIEESQAQNTVSINWLKIEIPNDLYYLDLNKSFEEQSDFVKNSIFDNESLKIIFQNELKSVSQNISKTLQNLQPGNNQKAYINQMTNIFYEDKRKFIQKLSVIAYINFLNTQNIHHNADQTSGYLHKCGIKGVKYNDNLGQRILLFRPDFDIKVIKPRFIDVRGKNEQDK